LSQSGIISINCAENDDTERYEFLGNLGLAPAKKPDYGADYQNDEDYPRPDSCLEDIANHFTATQANSRKKHKYEVVRFFHQASSQQLVSSSYFVSRCLQASGASHYY